MFKVANLIGADPREIIFTSGATESNNMAIKGAARYYGKKKKHIITTQIEHKCVLDSCRFLEATENFEVMFGLFSISFTSFNPFKGYIS